jgi:phage FluMu protein Com
VAAGDICSGSCNSGYRKARALYSAAMAEYAARLNRDDGSTPVPPDPPDIQPWLADPIWCSRCCAAIRRELAELDDLAAVLAAMPPGIRPAITGQREHVKVSGTREHASPSPMIEELDELADWARQWEAAYKGRDAIARRDYLATQLTTAIGQLLFHFDAIIAHEDIAPGFGAEVRRWHRELTSMSHAASAARHVKKPCPRCRLFTLWETLGEDYIRCTNVDCNRMMTRAELDQADSETALTA